MKRSKLISLIFCFTAIAVSIAIPFQSFADEFDSVESAQAAGSYGYNSIGGVDTWVDYPTTSYDIMAGSSAEAVQSYDQNYNIMAGLPSIEVQADMSNNEIIFGSPSLETIPIDNTPIITGSETNSFVLDMNTQPIEQPTTLLTSEFTISPAISTNELSNNSFFNYSLGTNIKETESLFSLNDIFSQEPAYSYTSYLKEFASEENQIKLDGSAMITLKEIEYWGMDPLYANQIEDGIMKAAKANNLNPDLLRAIAKQESNFNPLATSSCEAKGLTQLMDQTAASLGVKNSYDIYENLNGGAKYIREHLDTFNNLEMALAAYNAGAGNVLKYGGIPPFGETQAYVANITHNFEQYSFQNQGFIK
jgi:hypothetical protein